MKVTTGEEETQTFSATLFALATFRQIEIQWNVVGASPSVSAYE